MRLNVGSGEDLKPGYINCDLFYPADVKCDALRLPFRDNSVDEIFSSHMLEHFDFLEAFVFLHECFRVLKTNGKLSIETPDFLNNCKAFVEADEQTRINLYNHFFACPWIAGQTHKFLYTENQLSDSLSKCGFKNIKRIKPDSKYVGGWFPDELYLKMEGTK